MPLNYSWPLSNKGLKCMNPLIHGSFSINICIFIIGWIHGYKPHGYGGLTMGVDHLQILVSEMGPRTNHPWIPRDDCIFSHHFTV